MRHKVEESIRQFSMFSPGDGVVVGLSGGADSVTLLHLLHSLSQYGLQLYPCHINHNLRGEEALRDQRFCEELCRQWGLSLRCFSVDAAGYAREHRMSVEQGARELRYQCFVQLAQQTGATVIATAHTLSDSVETVLLSLSRGTALAGICGIPPVRRSEEGLRIVRPLIGCTRAQVEEYCVRQQLSYVTDSTNLSDDYTRNRIRHQVVPLLQQLNPSLEQTVERMTQLLRLDEDYLERQVSRCLEDITWKNGFSRTDFCVLDPALQGRVLRRILSQAGLSYDQKRLALCQAAVICGKGGVTLGKDLSLQVSRDCFWLQHRQEQQPFFSFSLAPDQERWQYEAAGKRYDFRLQQAKVPALYEQTEKFEKSGGNVLKNTIDYDKIYGTVKLRQKGDGDRFTPVGHSGSHSLKKLYQQAAISPLQRRKMAVLEDEMGIIWAEGFGCDRRVMPDQHSQRLLEISVSFLQHDTEEKKRRIEL